MVANSLLINAYLLGHLGVGVFDGLPTHPAHQALSHGVVGIDLGHHCHEGLPACQANQARHIEVNHHRLAVSWQVADKHRAAAVFLDTMQFATVRAQAGDGCWLCLDVVFGVQFLHPKLVKAGKVQDASHAVLQAKKRNCSAVSATTKRATYIPCFRGKPLYFIAHWHAYCIDCSRFLKE
jgi:hypothetical protein